MKHATLSKLSQKLDAEYKQAAAFEAAVKHASTLEDAAYYSVLLKQSLNAIERLNRAA